MVKYDNYNQGDIIDYGTDPTAYMTLAAKISNAPLEARTLLFSDDPEYVAGPGIMYQDSVSGNFRVFAYHVNSSRKSSLYFSILITNPHSFPVTVAINM